MSAIDRVERLPGNFFKVDDRITVTRRGGPTGDLYVDVDRNLGRHEGSQT